MPLFPSFKRPHSVADACDFLCAGAHKAGTTWLWANLGQHPQVSLPLVKEVHYFDRLHIGVNYPDSVKKLRVRALADAATSAGAAAVRLQSIAEGCSAPDDDWYRSLFDARGKALSGEFSPEYLCLGLRGVQHVAQLSPQCRVVIFVREPVARMVSALCMGLKRQPGHDPLRLVEQWLFLERGNYAGHIPVWDHVFGAQVLYIPYGRIARAPLDVLGAVERHLSLDTFSGYNDPARVYNSHTIRDLLPEDVMRRIRRAASRQTAFLQDRFGAAFCAET